MDNSAMELLLLLFILFFEKESPLETELMQHKWCSSFSWTQNTIGPKRSDKYFKDGIVDKNSPVMEIFSFFFVFLFSST